MENGWGLIGVIVGIIGTLLSQFFTTLYDTEKNNKKESKKIFTDKYNIFKKNYKLYTYSFALIRNAQYKFILLPTMDLNVSKEKIDLFEETRNNHIEILKNIMELLEEDYYIIEKLIDYEKLKTTYIDILKESQNVYAQALLWKFVNTIEPEELRIADDKFITKVNDMEQQLKDLNYKFQEMLYKDLPKIH